MSSGSDRASVGQALPPAIDLFTVSQGAVLPRARRFVLLDRDGTLIVERNYLAAPEGVELLPHAAAGLERLGESGWGRLLLTNQSGVGRGYFDLAAVRAVHRRLLELLARQGASLEGIYVCPHVPEDGCDCRKPRPGLALRAAADWRFDPRTAVVIGDKASDIDLGKAIGALTILVRTGYGETELSRGDVRPDWVANDLEEAAELAILKTDGAGDRP
ncbi:MAG: D-glycero-alpha-D-manno-heptose-1,7-bisphosphate 7-phosphatase [Bryobacteraceae bacterium]